MTCITKTTKNKIVNIKNITTFMDLYVRNKKMGGSKPLSNMSHKTKKIIHLNAWLH